jgi:hypothetical protein
MIPRIATLLAVVFTATLPVQSQPNQSQTKPSDVFFFDPAHPDQRGAPYNIGTGFAPKNEKPAASIVAKGVVLRGWLVGDKNGAAFPNGKLTNEKLEPCTSPSQKNCGTFLGFEDVHYELVLDYDFINSMYQQNAGVLNGAMFHGNPVDSQTPPIPVADAGNKTPSGIGINSFWLPYGGLVPLTLGVELNAWHARGSQQCTAYNVPVAGNVGCDLFENYAARGPAPAGWVEREFDYASWMPAIAADNWWPFDPFDPDGLTGTGPSTLQQGPNYAQYQRCIHDCDCAPDTRGKPNAACINACTKTCQKTPNAFVSVPTTVPKNLQAGDYVEIQGTLWQDVAHDAPDFWQKARHHLFGSPLPTPPCWGQTYHNQDGWLEIHPVDSIRRIPRKDWPSPADWTWDDKTDKSNPHWQPTVSLPSSQAGVKRVVPVSLCADAKGQVDSGSSPSYAQTFCPDNNYDPATVPARQTPPELVPHVSELIDVKFSNLPPDHHGDSVNRANPECVDIHASLTGAPFARYKATYAVWWTPGPPAIINQPGSNAVRLGQTARFVVSAGGAQPLSYQWRRNGMVISGATSPSYVTPPVTPSDLGAQFAVVVSNSAGSVTSSAATILGMLSATVSSSAASNSPVTDTVTVTSGGAPVAGVTITSGNSTYVTKASGVVVITHSGCFTGPVGKVGDMTAPKRTPVPCNWTATASKAGYQSLTLTLP